MILSQIFTFLLIGTLYATFSIFIKSYFEGDDDSTNKYFADLFVFAYLILIFSFIIISITKPIETSRCTFTSLTVIFGIYVFVSFGLGLRYFYDGEDTILRVITA